MIKYILVALTFLMTSNLIGQEKIPVFVSTAYMNWFDKEVNKLESAIADLKTCEKNEHHLCFGYVKRSLNNLDQKLPTIYAQMAIDMDEQNIQRKKDEYVDGKGQKYDIELAQRRQARGIQEVNLTYAELESFKKTMTEISELNARFMAENYGEKASKNVANTLTYLSRVSKLVGVTESLIGSDSSIN